MNMSQVERFSCGDVVFESGHEDRVQVVLNVDGESFHKVLIGSDGDAAGQLETAIEALSAALSVLRCMAE